MQRPSAPTARTVLTGSTSGDARLWDTRTGQQRGQPLAHGSRVDSVAFSPDGYLALTEQAQAGTVRLWAFAESGRPAGGPLDHPGGVNAVAFRPNGQAILVGGGGGTARLLDAVTGQPVGPPLAHQARVVSVAFSPDGRTVLTHGNDRTARLWRADTGEAVGEPLEHPDQVWDAAFGPRGDRRHRLHGPHRPAVGRDHPGGRWARPWFTRTRSTRSPSAPTARPCSPGDGSGPPGCGTQPPAGS